MYSNELMYLLRVVLAGICGLIIGMERRNRSKEAGVRTHFVVACGAAIMMVVSKYAFFDVIQQGAMGNVEVRLDPSRVASTIASGIGFLGAGMIFVHKNTITGLTTAAGIWATSGVGMAIGSGMYIFGIAATVVIVLAQYVLHIDFHKSRNLKTKVLSIKEVTENNYQAYIKSIFDERRIVIVTTSVENIGEGKRNYLFKIEIPTTVTEEEIISMINYHSSIKPAQ